MDVPLTTHASQIHPERFKTAISDAEVEAMAGYTCCTLRSDDGPRTGGRMHVEASCYDGMSIPESCEQLANDPGCCKCFEAVHAGLGRSNQEFTAGRVRSMQVAN